MSDISFDFPIWVTVPFFLAYALPLTTIILVVVLVAAWLSRRQRAAPRGARSLALDVALVVTGVLWFIGIGGWVWVGIARIGDWLA
jgi:hypothetical protein